MCHCDGTFFFFSSNFVSYCLFFPYCSSSPHSLKSLINFSLACVLFLLTLACSLSFPLCLPLSTSLSFLYLFQFCRRVCGGLSKSLISALFSSFLWLSPPFLIGKLFNPSLCPPLSSSCVVSLSPSFPLFFPPSLPLFFVGYCVFFSPLCALTGLFLSLIVMAGSPHSIMLLIFFPLETPLLLLLLLLHSPASVKKKMDRDTPSPSLPIHTPLFPRALPSFYCSAGERFNKTGLFWPVTGPQPHRD